MVGTLNMLGLAKRVGARFLLTSTSEVYGDPLQHPQAESYWGNVNPIGQCHMGFNDWMDVTCQHSDLILSFVGRGEELL